MSTSEPPKSAVRIFFFANQGHGSTAVEAAQAAGHTILGLCTQAPEILTLRNRIGRLISPFRDPFGQFKHPSRMGHKWFPDANLADVESFLKENPPDLILTCSFRRKVPKSIIDLARYAAINIHPGLLPERGGGTPNRWAIREGDTETGVSAHLMTEKWDHGHVVFQRRVPIRENAIWGDVELSLAPLIRDAVNWLARFQDNDYVGEAMRSVTGEPQAPRLQKSFRGENFTGQALDECRRICRATLPKGCGFRMSRCQRQYCRL